MVAGHDSCTCEACGAQCRGKFDACKDVWAAGPVKRAPIEAGIKLPTTGATSAPTAQAIPEPFDDDDLDDDDRIERLETTVAKMGRDLRSLHKRLRQPPELPPSYEERFDQVEQRIDNIAVDLGDALRLMQATVPDVRLDQLSRRIDDMRVEMREALEALRRPQPGVADKQPDNEEVSLLNKRITELGNEVLTMHTLVAERSKATGPSRAISSAEALWPGSRPSSVAPPAERAQEAGRNRPG